MQVYVQVHVTTILIFQILFQSYNAVRLLPLIKLIQIFSIFSFLSLSPNNYFHLYFQGRACVLGHTVYVSLRRNTRLKLRGVGVQTHSYSVVQLGGL